MKSQSNDVTEIAPKADTFGDIFKTLGAVDVSDFTKKKMNLSYLTWSQAWQFVLENYPSAVYEFEDFNGVPFLQYPDGSAEVRVKIYIGANARHMWLPIMDNKNSAINQPNSRQVSDTKMRCLVKCLAMFGLGLDVYGAKESIDLEPESIGDVDDALPGPEKDLPLVISEAQLKLLNKKIESENWSLDACKKKWGVNDLADVPQEQYQRIMSKKSEEKANDSAAA